MKNTVIATRSANQVHTIINGTSMYVTLEDKEKAVELYKEILQRKDSGTDEDMDHLLKLLSPQYKLDVDLKGTLKRDRIGNYYLGGYSRALPGKLLEVFRENIEDELPIENLVNFWKLLMLNPDEHVKDSLFMFMDRFKMPITDNGYFIAYKSVAWKGEDSRQLGVFVSQKYVEKKASGRNIEDLYVVERNGDFRLNTIEELSETLDAIMDELKDATLTENAEIYLNDNYKLEWKLASRALTTHEDIQEFALSKGWDMPTDLQIAKKIVQESDVENHGLLTDLFKNITSMFDFDTPTFTDWHTKNSTICLGEPVTMPREETDNNPNNTCSSGLHVGAPGYVSGFGYGEKNYIIACLVNPMNVVAIPHDYNFEKMRCCEYLPYAVCEFEDGNIKELNTNYFEEDYINYEVEILKDKISEIDDSTDEGKEQKSIMSQRLVDLSI